MYVKSINYLLWKIITCGDIEISSPEEDWEKEEFNKM